MCRDIKDKRDIHTVETPGRNTITDLNIDSLTREDKLKLATSYGLGEEPKEVYKGKGLIPNYEELGTEEIFAYTLYLPINNRDEDAICRFLFEYKIKGDVKILPYEISYGFNPICFKEDRFVLKDKFIEFLQYEAPYVISKLLSGDTIG